MEPYGKKRKRCMVDDTIGDLLDKTYEKSDTVIDDINDDICELHKCVSYLEKMRRQCWEKINKIEDLKNVFCDHKWKRDDADYGPYERAHYICTKCKYVR